MSERDNRDSPVLAIEDVTVDYRTPDREVRALDGASLSVAAGDTVGVVGESGSGKSTLGLLVGRLLPPRGQRTSGRVVVDGEQVLDLPDRDIARVRREKLGFIPQDPVGSLNPTLRVGRQLRLALPGRSASKQELVDQLERVQIDDPQRVLRLYPHEVSGGMAQRIAIAMAMARQPRILVADEPTAALDSQVREEVLRLVFGLANEAGTTVLWLSHDLNAVSRWCRRIAVMYGGRVVEDGLVGDVLERPEHRYTAALAASDPARVAAGERLAPIGGSPATRTPASVGCAFAPRCAYATAACGDVTPPTVEIGGRTVLCHHPASSDGERDLVGAGEVQS
ncbi:ABC transporter ATP-binding protein [Solicola gregarius]|uniref:ABC transporter ATP-binding protein n=1 Tax=Solicola gregarius TaxID=2908642 RepID=A0AA46TJT6_9ACTN|nr:ABC transporter ATP-binding protein [Solicola gregarius]UYM06591.1 ABC transporter ATP-binding protein [Solicola gregarius]